MGAFFSPMRKHYSQKGCFANCSVIKNAAKLDIFSSKDFMYKTGYQIQVPNLSVFFRPIIRKTSLLRNKVKTKYENISQPILLYV